MGHSGNAFSVSHVTENIETGVFIDFRGRNGGHCGRGRGRVVGVGMRIDGVDSCGGGYS